MPTDFTMPKLGLTMEEGTILEWLVPDGATVADGDAVLLVETDKVETEVNVTGSGRLHQLGAVGDTFACGAVIGRLLAEDDPDPDPPTRLGHTSGGAVRQKRDHDARGGRLLVSPNARRVAAEHGVDVTAIRGTGPGGRIVSEDVEEAIAGGTAAPAVAGGTAARAVASVAAGGIGDAVVPVAAAGTRAAPSAGASPPATAAARQLADLLGIDLVTVAPDPAEARITRDSVAVHVRSLLAAAATVATAPAAPPAPPLAQRPVSVVPMRGMRSTIAKRMHGSLQEMAQLTLTMDADLTAVVADRAARGERGTAPGYTDYVVAAAAKALREHPIVNSQLTADGVALLPDIHIGVAVAVDDGLMVPVVRHADRLDLEELAAVTTRLAAAARARTLELSDLEGATFSVTALGMYGVDAFTPIVNPPNVAILGVGRLRDDVVLVDGAVGTVTRLTLSLTWDHRVLDGAPAADFCRAVTRHLAAP